MKLIKLSLFIVNFLPVNNLFTADKPIGSISPHAQYQTTYSTITRGLSKKYDSLEQTTTRAQAALIGTGISTLPSSKSSTTPTRTESPTPSEAASMPKARHKTTSRNILFTDYDDYTSDSEKPTEFSGEDRLLDISKVPASGYQPTKYLPTAITAGFFKDAMHKLKNDIHFDNRILEKAAWEAENIDSITPQEAAEFSLLLNEKSSKNKHIIPNAETCATLSRVTIKEKERIAISLAITNTEEMKKLRLQKKAEVAALTMYGRMHGSGRTSPESDYGSGSRFTDDISANQQALAKIYTIKSVKTKEADLTEDSFIEASKASIESDPE